MKNVVIVGTGDFALVALQMLLRESAYKVIAFSEEKKFIRSATVEGLPNIPFEEIETNHAPGTALLLIAIGPNKINTVRERIYLEAKRKGYSFVTYISPQALVWSPEQLGENTFIFPGSIIEPFAKIGNNCVLWSGSIVAHHSEVKDHCFLAPGASVSGRSVIGANSFIGINSTIRDNIVIGEKCIIGAGALVKKNIESGGVYSEAATTRYNDDSMNTKV
jgi:sugar O-acyltransferase (sialic acid O-acetyltransferase NeuD family)